ncbi:hypothetical protein [Burkholderia sp. Ac-20365]|uniref:hypothetical protein n=1 Tax=Burkholderia sp. Ac-20365 TaxID=2703897 RepID=UPI00197B392C|nr:hypothetical protein [Burkholderia sp. Ac-20365]MBN3761058.1 hypothetical protein [Burkholderia sp. Ac-20365]
MQKLKFSLGCIAAAVSLAFLSPAAVAGGGGLVFDPTNFAQNIQTAMATVKTESLDIEEAIRSAQMLENSIKNTANTVSNLSGIGSITNDIASLQSQWNVDQTLMTQLGGQANFVQNVMSQYAATGTDGSFTDYVQALAKAAQQGQQNANGLFSNYTSLTQELQKTINQRQSIALKNSGALGTNDAIQVTNASLDNIAEINQATLQGINTLVRQQAYQQMQQSGRDGANAGSLDSYNNAKSADAQNFINRAPTATTIMGY